MRHATAADPGGSSDALRPLTEQGRREARGAGRALRDEGAEIAVVLSSPRLRARQTAELVLEGLGRALPIEIRETLNCGATGDVYLAEIRAQNAGAVLLVGHNPEMSAFASSLVGQPLSFRPATLCAIDLEEDGAGVRWLRHPGES